MVTYSFFADCVVNDAPFSEEELTSDRIKRGHMRFPTGNKKNSFYELRSNVLRKDSVLEVGELE